MTYPYRAARFDYGPRKGTLGLCAHMSEGGDELVGYLAGNPARGVSANFALLTTGVMWQMLPNANASGSLNPADRSTDKAYYGHKYLVDVLGDHWTDPNTWVISLEIAGHAATGPNAKQVAAIVAWAADMKSQFPTLRGAFGHADQTDTKGCPGTTAAMRGVFDAIGGHGLWTLPDSSTTGDAMTRFANANGLDLGSKRLVSLAAGTPITYLDGSPYGNGKLGAAITVPHLGIADAKPGNRLVVLQATGPYADGIARDTVLIAVGGTELDAPVAPAADCSAVVEAARVEASNAATTVAKDADRLTVKAAVEILAAGGLT
jgi:hypothetical protein